MAGTWAAGGNLATARNKLAGAGTQTAGLSFGGYVAADSAITEEYDGTTWSAGGNLATARSGLAGAGTQVAGLSFGGYAPARSAITEEYDGTTWSAGGNLATARGDLAGAGTQTAGLSFGGFVAADSAITEEYDGTTWSAGGNLATARYVLAGAGTQTAGLSFGGYVAAASAVTEEYDGTTWSAGGDLATARRLIGGCGTQTAGLSFGGYTTGNVATTEEYDGTSWAAGGDLATARYGIGGAGTQAVGLSFGGYTTVNVAVTEEYTTPVPNNTYLVVSSTNPDLLDVYVDGIKAMTVTQDGITLPAGKTVDGIDVSAHDVATTAVHGVGASTIESVSGSQAKVDTHKVITTGVHGVGASTVESTSGSQAKVDTHAAVTTSVHGITNTAQLMTLDTAQAVTAVKTFNANVGVGITPTAALHLKAGTTAANTAPIKFTTQASPLTTVEQGTMELVGNSLQFSQLAKRRGVAMSQNVIIATTTTANTTVESAALITGSHGANYLEVGKREEIELNGMLAQRSNPAAILTIRVKYAGVTKVTIATPASTLLSSRQFTLRVSSTVRTTGATGTMQMNAMLEVNGLNLDPSTSALATINTTIAEDTTVTVQWGEADVANTISVEQGRVLSIEPNR